MLPSVFTHSEASVMRFIPESRGSLARSLFMSNKSDTLTAQ